MDREELITQLALTVGKTKVNKLCLMVKEQKFSVHDLIDISFHDNKTIAFRAAWLLENVFLANPVGYLQELDYLLEKSTEVTYPGCQRHYAKIIMHMTAPKVHAVIKQKLQYTDLEPVVEKCFDWLIDPKVLIAVKVFAAQALFNLRNRYHWITDELISQIEFLMKTGTAAIQIRGKKLLVELKT